MEYRSLEKLRLLYDIAYCTVSVIINVADPILDLIVGFNYLANNEVVFGIATLCLCVLPTLLMSAFSFQWLIYDSTVEAQIKPNGEQEEHEVVENFHKHRDYTQYFKKKGVLLPQNDDSLEKVEMTSPTDQRYEDVIQHSPETMDEIAIDGVDIRDKTNNSDIRNGNNKPGTTDRNGEKAVSPTKSDLSYSNYRRMRREQSEVEVDIGISKIPYMFVIPGPTIDRKKVYKRTLAMLKKSPVKPSWDNVKIVEVVFHILGLPGIVRYVSLLRQSIRVYKKRHELNDKYHDFVKEAAEKGIKEVSFNVDLSGLYHQRRDAAFLRLMEGSMEATPQLLLQLYIIVKYTQWDTNWFTYLSVGISFTSVVWSLTSYKYEHRAATFYKASMTMFTYALTILIKLFMCLSRITAILLAATYSGYLVLGMLIGHWLVCLFYVCYLKTHFYGNYIFRDWFFKFIMSITMVLTFINIVDGNSFMRWSLYHIFTFLQNIAMLLLWYIQFQDPTNPDAYGIMLICLVVGGTLVGSLLTLIYYQMCHPSQKIVMQDAVNSEAILQALKEKYTARTASFETSL